MMGTNKRLEELKWFSAARALSREEASWLIEQAEIASNYGSLVMEHADLFHFKQIAKKHLTAEQLEDIQEEMEDVPETSF